MPLSCLSLDPCRYAVAQRLGDLMEEFEYDENPLGYMQEVSLGWRDVLDHVSGEKCCVSLLLQHPLGYMQEVGFGFHAPGSAA